MPENKSNALNAINYKMLLNKYKILIVLLFMVCLMSFASQYFLTMDNITNIIRQISINAILAMGMTFVLITGGIDLSVGSVLAVGGVIVAGLIKNGTTSIFLAAVISLMVCSFLGFANGVTIAKFKIPPFVITLAMMTIARGIAYIYTDGRPIVSLSKKFLVLGQGSLGLIPYPIIVMAIVVGLTWVLLNMTKFGRYIFAVGGNAEAARVSGINSSKILTLTYTLNGFLAGIAGIILTSRINCGQPQAGVSYEMDAIAAAVIGGTSLSGGIGTIGGTLIGALIIGVINNSLNLLGVSQYYQLIVKGFVIAIAVIIDVKSQKSK
ncbi:MAG: ribose ABC transporter permease [Bacillota bacterium]|jgi:ribose transport system permease protein